MNEQNEKVCLNCNRTDEKVPLIGFFYKGMEKYICPQCLPVMIHKTQQLADKLPGVEITPPADH
jgi:predicted RNA-binding protein with PUA domain